MALSRAVRTAPTWISAAFSARSVTRSMPVLVSTSTVREARVAFVLARVVCALALVVVRLRARVAAARLAAVERWVAAVLRRAVDFWALALRWVLVWVFWAMMAVPPPPSYGGLLRRLLLSSVLSLPRTYVLETGWLRGHGWPGGQGGQALIRRRRGGPGASRNPGPGARSTWAAAQGSRRPHGGRPRRRGRPRCRRSACRPRTA